MAEEHMIQPYSHCQHSGYCYANNIELVEQYLVEAFGVYGIVHVCHDLPRIADECQLPVENHPEAASQTPGFQGPGWTGGLGGEFASSGASSRTPFKEPAYLE